MRILMNLLVAAMLSAATGMWATSALASEEFPSRPIKLIVPYPPGGGIDPTARFFAKALSEELGAPFVIQNTGGASGQIGTELAAKAAPDGYTLLFASAAPNAILPAALPKLPYSNDDFVPITLIGSAAYVLVINPAVPANNIRELLQGLKQRPDMIGNFGSSGQLSGPHLAGELFRMLANAEMTHVAYRGNGPALTAVLGGEVPMMFASAPAVMPHVKDGRLKALGISAAHPASTLPELPALGAELPGLEVAQWYGLMAPKGTADAVVQKIYAAAARAMASKGLNDQLSTHGVEARPMTPAQFGDFLAAETRKYKDVVERARLVVGQ